MGWGTYGSRTTAVGGAALMLATRKIKDKAKLVAAHLLEAAVEDIDYADGRFFVKGSPDKAKTIQDIALMANVAWNMPRGHGSRVSRRRASTTRRTSPTRSARTSRSSRSIAETGRSRAEALRRAGRLRSADQPDDRRRPGARRRRPGHRPGAVGGSGLRRERPAADRLADAITRCRAPTCCPTSKCCRRSRRRRTIRSA